MQKMIFHLLILLSFIASFAVLERETAAQESFKVLIVHSVQFDDDRTIANMKRVFLYYTENVHITTNVNEYSLSNYTHIVLLDPNEYFTQKEIERLRKTFAGIIINLGMPLEHIEQWNQSTDTIIEMNTPYIHGFLPIIPINGVYNMNELAGAEVVLLGRNYVKEEIPLLIREYGIYHLLIGRVPNELIPLLIEGFRSEFRYRSVLSTQYHLQITDVHPLIGLDNLTQLTDMLIERKIPFSMAVAPIIIRETDNKTIFIKDNTALIKILQKLQSNGYPILVQQSLSNGESYPLEQNMEKLVKEKIYPIGIYYEEKALTIQELTQVKYDASTIVADIYSAPFMGKMVYQPAQIKGKRDVVLAPIQIPLGEDLIQFRHQWRLALRTLSVLPDQQVSILFPSYEVLDKLEIVVTLLKEEQGQWLDLLKFAHFLEVEGMTVIYNSQGYRVRDEIPFLLASKRNFSFSFLEMMLWGLVFVVLFTVLLFGSHSWRLRRKRHQLLFKEKKING